MIDPLRHLSVFKPHQFGNRRVDIIGAGATGSKVAWECAKLGIVNIHVWDFDTVEEHNIANQVFGTADLGRSKVEALRDIIASNTGTVIQAHNERVDGTQELGEIVFLLTDTMSSRKEIWDKGIKLRLSTQFMIETRMDVDNFRVYALNPNRPGHISGWENTLYADEETPVSACGASTTVGATAAITAGFAVWQLINWAALAAGGEATIFNETLVYLRPPTMIARNFD